MDVSSKKYIGLYARVSSKGQLHTHFDDGCSLDTQWDLGLTFCERAGLDKDLLILYREEGKSAVSTNRPEYKKLIEDIKQDKLFLVLFLRNDRISRNYIDFTELYNVCTEHNVQLIPIDMGKPINMDDPHEWFTNAQLLLYLQFEPKMASRRVRDYHKNQLNKGVYPYGGTFTIGLTKTEEGKITLSDNYEEKEAAREIFDSLIKGECAVAIADRFTFEYKLKKIWNADMVIRIARNPLYMGVYVDSKGNEYRNLFLGDTLVTEEEFNLSQYQLNHSSKNRKYDYIFKDIVYCDDCGMRLTQKSTNKKGKIYQYYYCTNCKKRVNENKIYTQMHDKLLRIYRLEIMKERYSDKEKSLDNEVMKLEKRINEYYNLVINDPEGDLTDFYQFQKKTNIRIKTLKEEKKNLLKNCLSKNIELSKNVQERIVKKYIDKINVNLCTNIVSSVEMSENATISDVNRIDKLKKI